MNRPLHFEPDASVMRVDDLADLRDIGNQMDFVAYLVAMAAQPARAAAPTIPCEVDLQIPHVGLESLLRMWSGRVLGIVDSVEPLHATRQGGQR